ncbi:MAG: protein kinase [Oscillospiraceae bacterium]|nr:protein kinase [Oscillospiraceae bacterium]
MAEQINKNIWPGWETVRLIGRGSFGAVYEIERDMLGEKEKAALKVITIPQSSSDIDELYGEGYDEESITSTFREHLKNIVAEYSLMRKLNGSANVVNCDDVRYVQHDDGFGWDIYIKMELLTPLTKALGREVTDEQVIRIGSDICRALVLCKRHNIIHRDIKPANVFVSENGDYKLGDFGIAKTVEKTSGGTKIGTYEYMAPEVYHDQPYGSAADIYSLGMVLYWLLNERRTPFLKLPPALPTNAEKEHARKRRFSGEPIPAPAHGCPELVGIVLKACAYDTKDRYQSAEEMLHDLEALEENLQGKAGAGFAPEGWEEEKTVGAWKSRTESVPPEEPESAEEEGGGTVGMWSSRAGQTPGRQEASRGVRQGPAPAAAAKTPGQTPPNNGGRGVFCRKCGAPIQSGMSFCTNCGTPVPGAAPKTQNVPQTGAAAKTQNAPQKSGGKRKLPLLIGGIALLTLITIGIVVGVVKAADSSGGKSTGVPASVTVTPRPTAKTASTPAPTAAHVHQWTEATCTEPQKCKTCGEIGSPALGHDWIAATYEKPATCARCGATTGSPKGFIGRLSGNWADEKKWIVYTWSYPLVLNDPVENCFRLTMKLTITEYTGAPAGSWYLYGRDLNGKWTKIGDFTITKDQLGGGSIVVPFTFDPAVSFDQLTVIRKGTNGYTISYYLEFYDAQQYVR